MSVNIKDIPAKIKEPNSTNAEEYLVEKYDSLILKASLLNSLSKWIYFALLFVGVIFYFSYRGVEYPKYYLLIPVILGNIIYTVLSVSLRSKESGLEKRISDLEKEIVRMKLKKQFPLDETLKNRIENFYIQLNAITYRRKWTYIMQFPLDMAVCTFFYCLIFLIK